MSYNSGNHRSNTMWNRSNPNSFSSLDQVHHSAINNPHFVGNKRAYSPDLYRSTHQSNSSNMKLKTFRGYVTRLHETWGVIDHDTSFSFNTCFKGIPKVEDYVIVEAVHSPSNMFKWKATKVTLSNNGRDYPTLKTIMNSRTEPDDLKKRNLPRSRERSRDQRYDDGDRKRLKRDERDEKPRELEKEVHQEREKFKDYERVHPIRRSRSPMKRRYVRYAVKVPNELLTLTKADIITLKKRYPALYIPSDFFVSIFNWIETFSLKQPYTLDKPCSFHIMHKDCDPCEKNDAVLKPSDLDYVFSAKVMLMGLPSLDEVYKKTMCLAEDLHKEDEKSYVHLTRLIQFLVGSRGKDEPLAIGGPWSPSLDGENPETDAAVLIRTAIRTCKALTGIDLSSCSRWYRFMEVYYHRSESVHKGKTIPARVETVVFFLPEVWNCIPTCLEWDNVILNYKKLVEAKLRPEAANDSILPPITSEQAEESDKEEDLVVIDKCEEKVEPTHYSELDPHNMKVNDLRQELEARSLSTKGLKPQLIQRLELALKKEKDDEAELFSDSATASKLIDSKTENEVNEVDVKMDEELKVVDELKVEDCVASDELLSEESKVNSQDTVDRVTIEKKYALPETPHIIVHPSRTAKSGKFDCNMMSLATLLDYRTNENKEHSFELHLFAETFYEMIQRDFGFLIYKALCEAPEKAKDEKVDKEQKKNDKDAKSTSVDENVKCENKEENEMKDSTAEKMQDDEDNENQDSGDVRIENGTKQDEEKNKDRIKLVTKDPSLLLSFVFFDRSRCGYIFDKDLEGLLLSLGLQLSRHQVKKLISKVSVRDTVHYRKLTDKPETEEEDRKTTNIDLNEIVKGNNKYLPVFSYEQKLENNINIISQKTKGKNDGDDSRPIGLINIGGATVDVEQVMTSLKKSETTRLEIEKLLLKYKKENDVLKESLKRASEKEKKISEDLKAYREKLTSANKDRLSLTNKSKTYYKTLMSIKDQISLLEVKAEKSRRDKSNSDKNDDKSSIAVEKISDDSIVEKSDVNVRNLSSEQDTNEVSPKNAPELNDETETKEAENNVQTKV